MHKILLSSKLPSAILSRLWDLSDLDHDGKLSCDEFVLVRCRCGSPLTRAQAMHLVNQCLAGATLPDKLPSELIPPAFKDAASCGSSGAAGAAAGGMGTATAAKPEPETAKKGENDN